AGCINAILHGWRRQMLTGFEVVFYFVENPRISDGRAADHDSVDSVFVLVFERFFGRIDIAVSENRNGDTRVVFDARDVRPIGGTFVELRSGACMDGKRFHSDVLQAFGDFVDVDHIVVPAEARFDRYREIRAADDRFGEAHHQVDIFEDCRAGTFTHDFLNRTSEVDIDQVGVYGFDDFGRHGHGFFVATENLDSDGPFVIEYVEFLTGFYRIADESFAGDELTEHQIGSVGLAQTPERRVADILHWGQQERKIGQLYVAYFNHRAKLRKSSEGGDFEVYLPPEPSLLAPANTYRNG